MKNFLSRLILATTAIIAAPYGASASNQFGKLTYSSADQTGGSGVVTINLTGAPAAKPACASTSDLRWTINLSSGKPANEYIYSLALTAMSLGLQINVVGTGACSTIPYLEDIAYIEVYR